MFDRFQGELFRIAQGVARRSFDRKSFFIYRAPEAAKITESPELDVRTATKGNLGDLCWFHRDDEMFKFEQFLELGNEGYLVYLNGVAAHRSWYVPGSAEVREHWSCVRRIDENEGWVHYCRTAPTALGKGLFSAALNMIAAEHRDKTVRMAIRKSNYASRRAAEKAGWFPEEVVLFLVILGIRWQRRRLLVVGG